MDSVVLEARKSLEDLMSQADNFPISSEKLISYKSGFRSILQLQDSILISIENEIKNG